MLAAIVLSSGLFFGINPSEAHNLIEPRAAEPTLTLTAFFDVATQDGLRRSSWGVFALLVWEFDPGLRRCDFDATVDEGEGCP